MITIGIDSYADTADAAAYVEKFKKNAVDNTQAAYWQALTPEQQEHYLRHAFLRLESVKVQGRKAKADQYANFPRGNDKEVPADVVAAQIEEALQAMSEDLGIAKASVDPKSRASVMHCAYSRLLLKPYTDGGFASTPSYRPKTLRWGRWCE